MLTSLYVWANSLRCGAPEDELYEKFSLRWRGVPGEVWWYGTGVSVGPWAQRRASPLPILPVSRVCIGWACCSVRSLPSLRKNDPRQPTQDTVALKHFPVTTGLKAWWQLLVVVLAVRGLAEHSIENRHIYLLYIAYVAACLPEWMTSPRPRWMGGAARTAESIKVMHKSESGSTSRVSPQSYCNTRAARRGSIYALRVEFCSGPRKTGMLVADTGSGGSAHSPPQSRPQQPCVITAAVLFSTQGTRCENTLFTVTVILLLLR